MPACLSWATSTGAVVKNAKDINDHGQALTVLTPKILIVFAPPFALENLCGLGRIVYANFYLLSDLGSRP